MRMVLCPIASGSSGNATFFFLGGKRLLVDAGISCAKLYQGLNALGIEPKELDAIFITHEHVDHVRGLSMFARKSGVSVYANTGTWHGILSHDAGVPEKQRRKFTTGEDFNLGGVNIHSFSIPHDASDPVGYTFSAGEGKLGIATDLGHLNETWLSCLFGCQALVLEANHDVDRLQKGPYPRQLKVRILSKKGHLCNEDSGRALALLVKHGTQAVFLGHLSKENNLPELAMAAASKALDRSGVNSAGDLWIGIARRDTVSDMLVLDV